MSYHNSADWEGKIALQNVGISRITSLLEVGLLQIFGQV